MTDTCFRRLTGVHGYFICRGRQSGYGLTMRGSAGMADSPEGYIF